MSTTPITASQSIQELQLNPAIQQAVVRHSQADFGMLLAMLSSEFSLPNEFAELNDDSAFGKSEIEVSPSPKMLGDDDTRLASAQISHQFHQGGLASAKLMDGLTPDALAYHNQNHRGLGEEVFHNLSHHQRQQLENPNISTATEPLINRLITNMRQSEMSLHA